MAGAVVLEDDPRFNAGTGSIVRLDGSIQMDASVMESGGRFGAVAGLERVKNPVLVARAVLDTPHLVLMGDGATRFARALGHARLRSRHPRAARLHREGEGAPARQGARPARVLAHQRMAQALELRADARRSWAWIRRRRAATPSAWPCARPTAASGWRCPPAAPPSCCAAGSGDVPIYGAGLYAGAHGAAAATGTGERIIEVLLAHTVHGWLAAGMPAPEAAQRGVDLIKAKAPTGLIVIGPTSLGAAASRPMAWAGREDGGAWTGPTPAATPAPAK